MLEKIFYSQSKTSNDNCCNLADLLETKTIDVSAFKKILNYYTTWRDSERNNMPQFQRDLVDYLSIALNNVDLTEKQREYLDYYLCGFSEKEIREKFNVSKKVLNTSLLISTKKIINELKNQLSAEDVK